MLVPGDVSDAAHCRAVVDRAVREFGGIDILVNNAAYQMMHKSLDEISDEEWDYTFRLNVGAYFHLTKAAIANLSASLAQLLGDKGIRVNSVAPGPIWTPPIPATVPADSVESFGDNVPLGRAGQPAELAPVYVLLASDDASYISGARVAVTGGRPIL